MGTQHRMGNGHTRALRRRYAVHCPRKQILVCGLHPFTLAPALQVQVSVADSLHRMGNG